MFEQVLELTMQAEEPVDLARKVLGTVFQIIEMIANYTFGVISRAFGMWGTAPTWKVIILIIMLALILYFLFRMVQIFYYAFADGFWTLVAIAILAVVVTYVPNDLIALK